MKPTREQPNATTVERAASDLSGLCRWGGYGAFALLLYSLGTLVQAGIVGMGAPADPAGIFATLREHPLQGLLRLDLPVMLAMPLYYLVFLGLFAALRRVDLSNAVLSTSLAFAGITLVVATPTALPMLRLSHMYAAATSDSQRAEYLAAGRAIMATDVWHHTGSMIGAVLLQIGAVLICYVMLKGVFSRGTAWLGIIMHGLDLFHLLCGSFLPMAGVIMMAVAGVLYPFWFLLVGRRLLQLAAKKASLPAGSLISAG